MEIFTDSIEVETRGHTDIIDITDKLKGLLAKSGLSEGHLVVFVSGSTAAITSIEYEPGLLKDLPEAFEKIAPTGVTYHHDQTWGDGNGSAHVRAAIVGPSFTAPFVGGKLLVGTWQQIVLVDFDNRSRSRKVVVQVTGK